jgi:hypothetical protein
LVAPLANEGSRSTRFRSPRSLAESYDTDAGELFGKAAGNPFFVIEALAAPELGNPNRM